MSKMQTASKHMLLLHKSLLVQVQCIPACACLFGGCKSHGSQVGVGAYSDIIEFIEGKSCLCFPWRSYGGSGITMVKQQTMVPVALIRMWLHPTPTRVFFMPLSGLRSRVIGQPKEMKCVHLRYVSKKTPKPSCLFVCL